MIISSYGLFCQECEFFEKTCSGCHAVQGKTFWAIDHVPSKVCPLFDCAVNTKKLSNCGSCAELPCETFRKMKDPSVSEEEHIIGITKRVERLTRKSF